ncbi:F-box/WD repeat-containing protein 4 isoform X2 [Sphaeramia orbicularis]|uniref:F-box/WD repeat-containing protein 4 isoform X2 n=1 Tax=Sphaeramia orbicularis TaxID=375764 RepID=UPI00117FF669|nr:F-box/WD repeat-containing protein 4 isoform X2 [Sphaeramia orbicularis]
MLLSQLPDDVLYCILSYLDYKSLSRLSQVCRSIYHFVNRDAVWRNIAKEFLNTGITRNGTDILLPWLQLDGDVLFLSQAADIGAYRLRQDYGRILCRPFEIYSGHSGDVCRFVLTDAHLISSGSNGKILVHSRRKDMSMELRGPNQEVNCLDSKNGLIISGSRDEQQSSFVTGTACCENFSPLHIWDVERLECVCSLGTEFRRGAGVLDMVFESPFQLLTCGYDTFIRLWDLRLSPRKCAMEWEEPHDSALYCIQTDGNYMIASGSSYYGVVRLWDKRQAKCLQFFQLSSEMVSSPVYCLRFCSSHLFAALATTLHSLDFRHSPIPIR